MNKINRFDVRNEKYVKLVNTLEGLGLDPKTEYVDYDKHVRLTTAIPLKTGFEGIVNIDVYDENDFLKIYNELLLIEKINILSEKPIIIIPDGCGKYFKYLYDDSEITRKSLLKSMAEEKERSSCNELDDKWRNLRYKYNNILEKSCKLKGIRKSYEDTIYNINSVRIKSNKIFGVRKKIHFVICPRYGHDYCHNVEKYNIDRFLDILNDDSMVNKTIEELLNKILLGNVAEFSSKNIWDINPDAYEIKKLEKILEIIEHNLDSLGKKLDDEILEKQKSLDLLYDKCEEINSLKGRKAYKLLEKLNPSMNDIDNENDIKQAALTEKYENKKIKIFPKLAVEEKLPANYQRYSRNGNDVYDSVYYDSLVDLQQRQTKLLTDEEKKAVIVYKTQLYRAMNLVIKYMRDNNLNYDEIKTNQEILKLIEKAHHEYNKDYEYIKMYGHSNSVKEHRRIDDAFNEYQDNKGYISLENYQKMIFRYLPSVESALKKVITEEDITVYRGVPKRTWKPNYFLSTSLSSGVAKYFVKRPGTYKTNSNDELIFYEITIPKGSPVIVFNEELYKGFGNAKNFLEDSQQEVLIDPVLFNFEYDECRGSKIKIDEEIKSLTYYKINAIPKSLELNDNNIHIKK